MVATIGLAHDLGLTVVGEGWRRRRIGSSWSLTAATSGKGTCWGGRAQELGPRESVVEI